MPHPEKIPGASPDTTFLPRLLKKVFQFKKKKKKQSFPPFCLMHIPSQIFIPTRQKKFKWRVLFTGRADHLLYPRPTGNHVQLSSSCSHHHVSHAKPPRGHPPNEYCPKHTMADDKDELRLCVQHRASYPEGIKKTRLLSILITFECYFVWLSVLFAQNQINHRHLRGRDIYPRETWRCAILKMIYFILVKHLLIDSGVAKTRVRVTPKVEVRVGVRMGVRLEGEGEFKGRVKAYGNTTVPMIMHRSRLLSYRLLSCSYHSSVTLTGFVEYKKEIFSQKLCSFADKAFRKKKSVQELRKMGNQWPEICLLISLPWSDPRVLILLYSWKPIRE